jgi:hypothetical protein
MHLAVKAAEDSMSTRSIRALILKGANPNILSYDGKLPIDYL